MLIFKVHSKITLLLIVGIIPKKWYNTVMSTHTAYTVYMTKYPNTNTNKHTHISFFSKSMSRKRGFKYIWKSKCLLMLQNNDEVRIINFKLGFQGRLKTWHDCCLHNVNKLEVLSSKIFFSCSVTLFRSIFFVSQMKLWSQFWQFIF